MRTLARAQGHDEVQNSCRPWPTWPTLAGRDLRSPLASQLRAERRGRLRNTSAKDAGRGHFGALRRDPCTTSGFIAIAFGRELHECCRSRRRCAKRMTLRGARQDRRVHGPSRIDALRHSATRIPRALHWHGDRRSRRRVRAAVRRNVARVDSTQRSRNQTLDLDILQCENRRRLRRARE